MRIRHWHKLLLAAVLVFGQSLAIAHDYQHPAFDGSETCQVCVHGPSFQAGPTLPADLNTLWLDSEQPLVARPATLPSPRHTHALIRAPPARLV